MVCLNCGKVIADEAKFCPECGFKTINEAENMKDLMEKDPSMEVSYNEYNKDSINDNIKSEHKDNISYNNSKPIRYAGFWRRFLAMLIDKIILSGVYFLINMIVVSPIMTAIIENMANDPRMQYVADDMQYAASEEEVFQALEIIMDSGGTDIIILISAVFFSLGIISWLYFALMESSKIKATVGKLALGIQVTDEKGNRISFLRATGRYFGKIISGLILYIGYIMAGFTEKKQALHDIMADCLVIKK